MSELASALMEKLSQIDPQQVVKLVISDPLQKEGFQKIVAIPIVLKGQTVYQFFQYTSKQVFHLNLPPEQLFSKAAELFDRNFKQLNLLATGFNYSFRSSIGNALAEKKWSLSPITEKSIICFQKEM